MKRDTHNCQICKHPMRAEIDAALVGGGFQRTIAQQAGITEVALTRHKECIRALLSTATAKRELALIANVREVLMALTEEMRFDSTQLFNEAGEFDLLDLRRRGLGHMLKSYTRTPGPHGDTIKVEAHSQQRAASILLKAYTDLEIAKQFSDEQWLSDVQRAERIAALLDRARERRDRHADTIEGDAEPVG